MKKIIFLPFFIIALLLFINIKNIETGKSLNYKLDIEKSEEFSKEDLDSAISSLNSYILSEKDSSKPERIYYSDDLNDQARRDYLDYKSKSKKNLKKENIIVLFADFKPEPTSLPDKNKSNERFEKKNFILVREDKNSPWEVWSITIY